MAGDGGQGGSAGGGGTGGSGGTRWDEDFWGSDCHGCRCEFDPASIVQIGLEAYDTTLECFCCQYHCEAGLGPFGNGLIDIQTIIEYDCDQRLIIEFTENPEITFLIDTTTGEVLRASFRDDSGVCHPDGHLLRAGERELPAGCEITSERTCDGCCDAGGAGGAGGEGGTMCDVGAFEVQP